MGKRIFDIAFSIVGLFLVGWVIALFFVLASIDTGDFGLFIQERIGQYGKKFRIYKIKSMRTDKSGAKQISRFGRFMRKTKIDEFPQLFNILKGDMSFVGPRPDISGYYDKLTGEESRLLELKPGITGIASLKYSNEEKILALHKDPVWYNDKVIFPDKVRINLWYLKNRTFLMDLKIMVFTILNKKFKE